MVRLTASLLQSQPVYTNALRQPELSLRSLGIRQLENLGVLEDIYTCIDLTDNLLSSLDGLPDRSYFSRCESLALSHNRLTSLPPLAHSLPHLRLLNVRSNALAGTAWIESLVPLRRLHTLMIADNPGAADIEDLHLWLIWRIPQLQVIDLHRITQAQRIQAHGAFGTPLPKYTSFVPGHTDISGCSEVARRWFDGVRSAVEVVRVVVEEERGVDRDEIRRQIMAATTIDEIRQLEAKLASSDGKRMTF
ncbi:U2 small nuclear ribonucleoprotein A' [Savitreella phatthalungensis]